MQIVINLSSRTHPFVTKPDPRAQEDADKFPHSSGDVL